MNTNTNGTPVTAKADKSKENEPIIPRKLEWELKEGENSYLELVTIKNISKDEKFLIIRRYRYLLPFIFEVVRYKDSETCEETLVITCYKKEGEEIIFNGSVETTLMDLDSDIKGFLRYGIALSSLEFYTLTNAIKTRYFDIKLKTTDDISKYGTNTKEELLQNILTLLKEYIATNEIKSKDGLFYIPVLEFNALLEQLEIQKYQYNYIRRLLKDGDYIKTDNKRNTVLSRHRDKIYRCLAFKTEKEEFKELIRAEEKSADSVAKTAETTEEQVKE